MLRVVAAQFSASLLVAAGAWAVGGHRAALSSLLGGLACALPSGLFALNLAWLGHLPKAVDGGAGRARVQALALLVGEFVKVALTIGLLVLIAWTVRDVVWSALIGAVSAVLLMQAVALL